MKTPALIVVLALTAFTAAQAADPTEDLRVPLVVTPRAATPPPLRRPERPPPEIPRVGNPLPAEPFVPITPKTAPSPAPYQPAARPDGKRVVALDIGHTVIQPGCYSATGRGEFFFNKQIVQFIYAALKDSSRIAPYIVNPEGAPISLPMRTQLAARRGAELFLAIHHDSAQDKYFVPWEVNGKKQLYCDDFQGYGVFISQKNPRPDRSLQFGKLLGAEMGHAGFEFSPHHSEPVKGENRQIIDKVNGIYEYNDLIVLKTALMPAALLECGVIVNRAQEKLLSERATQEKIAHAVATAIERFFVQDEAAQR